MRYWVTAINQNADILSKAVHRIDKYLELIFKFRYNLPSHLIS